MSEGLAGHEVTIDSYYGKQGGVPAQEFTDTATVRRGVVTFRNVEFYTQEGSITANVEIRNKQVLVEFPSSEPQPGRLLTGGAGLYDFFDVSWVTPPNMPNHGVNVRSNSTWVF